MKYKDVSLLSRGKNFQDLKSGELFKFTDNNYVDSSDLYLCLKIEGGYVNLRKNIYCEVGFNFLKPVILMESKTLEVWEK